MSQSFEGFHAPAAMTKNRSPRARINISAEPATLLPKPSEPWKNLSSSVSVSLVIHGILLLVLSWIYFDLPNRNVLESILFLVSNKDSNVDGVEVVVTEPDELSVETEEAEALDEPVLFQDDMIPVAAVASNTESLPGLDRHRVEKTLTPAPKAPPVKSAMAMKSAGKKGAGTEPEGQHVDHFEGRSPTAKATLLKRMGGNDLSEAAVGRGLVWLKNHQLPDGSWNFNHLLNPRCDCTMPGRLDNNPNAATAMALLAFLGAGHTHESGEYQEEVQQGLDFLLTRGTPAEKGVCFYVQFGGPPTPNFYTHGLVTIALSEAFAMTHDANLRPAIVGAIDFLVASQDLEGGGWRYFPGQAGDTSVVAWQLMALKSAQFSRIAVPQKVLSGVERFMSTVSSTRGSRYSYMPDRRNIPTPSMTAAGLLCRMYLDWKDTSGGLRAGVRFLDENGPDPEDMYYNYYATQVMHHWGGPEWDRWNGVMRDHLIRTQIREGHASGSWDVADRHGMMGGRVYMTTLALLTLEVYYRHLPLYQKDRIEIPLVNKPAEPKNP